MHTINHQSPDAAPRPGSQTPGVVSSVRSGGGREAGPDATRGVAARSRGLNLVLILLALPLILVSAGAIAAWIKLVSRGGVLFRQTRIGYLGRPFEILKFRTMHEGAGTSEHEAHVAELMRSDRPMTKLDATGDGRLIPGGRFLRMSGLDELPQIVNILRGEMSLVGPRPCLPVEYAGYAEAHRERCEVLPGLTGNWQANGKNNTNFAGMIALDIDYVRNRSTWMDVALILRTPRAIVSQALESRRPPRRRAKTPVPD